jgi:hypothetical protein
MACIKFASKNIAPRSVGYRGGSRSGKDLFRHEGFGKALQELHHAKSKRGLTMPADGVS